MPVPNFPILTELPLLLILRLKLPGNVAHGDHTRHVHSARPHTMASLPAHPGPAETPSSTLLIAKNRQNVPCFSATLSATRPETLCFVSVLPLTRLKTFYLFYESDCRYKTDVRFPENLQRFALCCTLCCTDVALRCTETPPFLLHRCPMQGLVPPGRCARNPVQRKAPGGHPSIGRRLLRGSILGMETRHGFGAAGWVLPGSEQLSSFIMIKHTDGGSESSNRSVF